MHTNTQTILPRLAKRELVSSDRKLIIPTKMQGGYIGLMEIDIDYCPECGRKLEERK